MVKMLVRKASVSARIPTRGSAEAAGFDMYADLGIGEHVDLYAGTRKLISLGVEVALPKGYYLQLKPRSGLASKHGIMVMGGVVDSDYRGLVYALLYNSGDTKLPIAHLDRICQGVILPIPDSMIEEVDFLPVSIRGDGAFGSTGR